MRLFQYFKPHKAVVALIALLLIAQAACDLALPCYTGEIVNIGIQQYGIERPSPDTLSSQTHDQLKLIMDDEDASVLEAGYTLVQDGTYEVTKDAAARERLDEVMLYPMALLFDVQSGISSVDLNPGNQGEQGGVSDGGDIEYALAEMKSQSEIAGESSVLSKATAAVKQEYEALGVDVSALQVGYLMRVGLVMMLLTLGGAAVSVAVSYLASRTASKIGASLRERMFETVTRFSDAEIQAFSPASLITRATNDIQQIQNLAVMVLRMVLFAPVLAVGGIIMVVATSPQTGWVIALAVVAVVSLVLIAMRITMPKFKIMQKLIDRLNQVSREILTGLPVVRAFNRQGYESRRFDGANLDVMSTQLFTNRVMSALQPVAILTMSVASAGIIWVGSGFVDAGTMQIGDIIALISYCMVVVMGFMILSMVAVFLPRAEVAAKRIDEVLETQPGITDPAQPCDDVMSQRLEGQPGAALDFDGVTFYYGDSAEPALRDINLHIPAGSTCAIIGSTGSGKSTLLKLIMRLYDATDGSVRLGGVDVRDVTQSELHEHIGYVPQKSFLFAGTIASNISFGNEGADQKEVDRAARIAQASSFISEKIDGFDAAIAQGGTNLSGGQRQRIAIARALATKAQVLLFDDSFSALDYATDAKLRSELSQDLQGRTQVIVAQRVSTVRSADTIVVLDEGRIVGQGTHDELMDSCDTYRQIALSQLSSTEAMEGGVA